MKFNELREKSADELSEALLKVREEQFRLRMQQGTGQLGQTHLLKQARRDVARIKTLLTQKADS